MASSSVLQRLRGLILSATELRELTNWGDALIEDYLNNASNVAQVAVSVDIGVDIDIQTKTSNYTTVSNDGLILADASANAVTIFLDDTALAGQNHTIKCTDDTFTCLVGRNGNLIDDTAESFELFKDESLSVRADSDNNWWIF